LDCCASRLNKREERIHDPVKFFDVRWKLKVVSNRGLVIGVESSVSEVVRADDECGSFGPFKKVNLRVEGGPGNWIVKDKNFTVPSEQFLKNLSAGPSQIDTYNQAEPATGLEACEKAFTKAKDRSEGYERGNKNDAIVRCLRSEECVDILA
jgi:hypothetical protein